MLSQGPRNSTYEKIHLNPETHTLISCAECWESKGDEGKGRGKREKQRERDEWEETVKQGKNANSQREERKRWSESTKIEGSGGAVVERDGRGGRERCSALCVFEYEQSPWINQAESWCHRGASVLFSPVQTVALTSRLKDSFTPKPNCNLQNVLTRM